MSMHQEKFQIRGNEIGPNLKLTLPAIAGYMQEAAWMHAMKLKVSFYELLKKGYTWVLARVIIEMDDFAKHNDTLSITTWPSGYDRHNILRDYHISNGDGVLIGKAKSIWVILDLKSRKVVQAPPFIKELTIQHQIPHVPFSGEKIPSLETKDPTKQFSANWFDIDVNRHVNHISYIKWVIESTPDNILKNKEARGIDIVFRSECQYGDQIMAYSKPTDDTSSILLHNLSLKDNKKELVLAKTYWR